MPEADSTTAASCPVCGQNNRCALANPATAANPCWCYSAEIDPRNLTHPAAVRNNKTCLCPQCAQATPSDAS